jgi:hypothetical protein
LKNLRVIQIDKFNISEKCEVIVEKIPKILGVVEQLENYLHLWSWSPGLGVATVSVPNSPNSPNPWGVAACMPSPPPWNVLANGVCPVRWQQRSLEAGNQVLLWLTDDAATSKPVDDHFEIEFLFVFGWGDNERPSTLWFKFNFGMISDWFLVMTERRLQLNRWAPEPSTLQSCLA